MADNLATTDKGETAFVAGDKVERGDVWHKLGHYSDVPTTAVEAIETSGDVQVIKAPLFYKIRGFDYPSTEFGLVRVSPDGVPIATLGTVKKGYTLVNHKEFCQAWDFATAKPIETFGILGNGEQAFLTHRLPDSDIAGDQHSRWIAAVNDCTGKNAQSLAIVRMRIVCQNTMKAALKNAAVFSVDHDGDVIKNMTGWLRDAMQTIEAQAAAIEEAMQIMAGRVLTPDEAQGALMVAAPIPNMPKKSGSPIYDAKRIEIWEGQQATSLARQSVIRGLYEGGMSGYTDACKGTAYGMINAVTEAWDWIIPTRGEGDRANVQMFGTRSGLKEKTFEYLVNICKN